MLSILAETSGPPVLFHVVESDDVLLADRADILWFEILRTLDWRPLANLAARYYVGLSRLNRWQQD